MTSHETQPNRTAVIGLTAVLLFLSISLFYPQAAYPLHGWGLGMGATVLGVLGLWGLLSLSWRSRLFAAAMAGAAGFLLWWNVRFPGAPVPPMAVGEMASAWQGFMIFVAVCGFVACWPREWREDDLHLPPENVIALWATGAGALLGLFAIYQVFGPAALPRTFASQERLLLQNADLFDPPIFEGMLHAVRERRASTTFGNPNVFAGFLAAVLPFALGLAWAAWLRRKRASAGGWLAAAAVIAVGVLLSGSRGGLLAAGLAGVLLVLLLLPARMRWIAVAGGVVALAAGLLLLGADRLGASSTVQQRLYYWRIGGAIWGDGGVLIGAGPGAYAALYPQFRMPGAQETAFAHNWLVHWGSEIGLVGVALFGLWVGPLLAAGERWRRQFAPAERALAAAFLASVLALLAHGLVEFTLSIREMMILFAILLGTLAGQPLLAHVGESARPTRWRLPACAALALLAAGAFWQFQARPALAWFHEQSARIAIQEDNDPAAAAASYTDALRWQPRSATLYEARALARRSLGDPRALDDMQRALALNPHSARLRETRARFALQQGQPADALRWQREAIAIHPADASHRLVLAEMLWNLGRRDEARAAFAETDGLLLPNRLDAEESERVRTLLGLPKDSRP
ncbi:MAG: hypothetical protein RLY93_14350 [Sumerlaeia bacterium]